MSATPDELLKSDYDPALIGRLIKLLRPYTGLFVFSVLLYIPLNLGALLQPFVMGLVVDRVTHPSGALANDAPLADLGLFYLGALALNTLGQFVQLSATQLLGQRMTRDLRKRLFAHLQRLDAAYFDRTPAGRVMTRLTSDVESLAEVFSSGSATLIGDVLFLLATAILLFVTSPTLTVSAFAVLPILAIGVHYFRRAARDAFRAVRTHLSRINGFLQEHISGMSVVQLFGQEARTADTFDEMNRGFREANVRAIKLDSGIYAFVEAVSTASIAILLVAAGSEVAENAISLGVAVAFVEYLQRFYMPVRDLSTKYTVVQSALAAAERVFGLLDEPQNIVSPPSAVRVDGIKDAIRFENVGFWYRSGTHAVRGVSFEIKRGHKVALVGRTGSGKSTLTRLLLRHYDVQEGRITLDGVDARAVELGSLRRNIVTVPQEVHLFSGTLEENLRFGAPNATDAQLWSALDAVQARGLVERLPGGLTAPIKERGQNLSVGERQLIAFARALVADPPFIILDEATASVDPETERRLQAATASLLERRTALIVAHRLTTLAGCDRIIVLQHGQIVEEGTHDELLGLGGYYARLHALQTGTLIGNDR